MIDDPETFDMVSYKRKSLSAHWDLMFTPTLYATPQLAEQHRILTEIAALVDSGVIRSTLQENYGTINAENLRRAHATLESGRSMGNSGF